jgi:hypothetical protein
VRSDRGIGARQGLDSPLSSWLAWLSVYIVLIHCAHYPLYPSPKSMNIVA